MIRFRSIISRIVAFHVVAIGVTAVLLPLALYYLLNEAANSLHRDALRSHAFTISSFLRPQPDDSLVLDMPPEVRPLYSGEYGLYAYAVLDADGHVLFVIGSKLDETLMQSAPWAEAVAWLRSVRTGGSPALQL